METSGAILLGSSVGETIRKGIVDPTFYYNDQMCNNYTGYNNENYTQYLCPDRLNNATLLLYGQLSAMLGKLEKNHKSYFKIFHGQSYT